MNFKKKIVAIGTAAAVAGGLGIATAGSAEALPIRPLKGHRCAPLHYEPHLFYRRYFNLIPGTDTYSYCIYRVGDYAGPGHKIKVNSLPNYTLFKR